MVDQSAQTISVQSLEIKPKVTFQRQKTSNDAFFRTPRKDLPLNVYFRSEESRRKHDFQKSCKPWYYYVNHENTFLYGRPSRQFLTDTSLPSVHKNLQAYSDLFPMLSHDKKRVAFENNKVKKSKEKLPKISHKRPHSDRNNTTEQVSDVTLEFTRPVKDEFSMELKDLETPDDNDEDVVDETEVYTISFRQDSGGDYDPQSELHSDYYTLKKIETVRRRTRPHKTVTIPDHRKNFRAVLLGSQKHLHKKFHIECEGFHSVPLLREWANHQRELIANRIDIPCFPLPGENESDQICQTNRTNT